MIDEEYHGVQILDQPSGHMRNGLVSQTQHPI